MTEQKEINYIMKSMIEFGETIGDKKELDKCLTTYRIIGETIKQHMIGDLDGTRYVREFKLCRGKLTIKVIHD